MLIRELNFCVLYRKQLMPTSNEAWAVSFHNVWQLIHGPPQQNSFSAGRKHHPSLEKVAPPKDGCIWGAGMSRISSLAKPLMDHHQHFAVQLLFWGGRSRKGSPGQSQGSSPPSCSVGEAALPQLWQGQSHTPACSLRCLWDMVNAPWEKNLLPKGTTNSQEPFLLPKGGRCERLLADSAPPKDVHLREFL